MEGIMELTNKYLTYNEYKNLGGDIPEMSFRILEYKAERKIDEKTFNRFQKISEYPQELKMCVYDLITELKKESTQNIVSESDGDYSVTYASTTKKELESNITGTIKFWLSNTKVNNVPVLYCGTDINEN
jgi:hypothetical protein